MESVSSTDLIALAKNPDFILLTLWLLREIYSNSKKRTQQLTDLTLAVVRLETKFVSIEELVRNVPRLSQDISALHQKFRSIEDQ